MQRLLVLALVALPAEPSERGDVEALVRLFCFGPPAAQATAAERLRRRGRRAWRPFAACLDHPDPDIRQRQSDLLSMH